MRRFTENPAPRLAGAANGPVGSAAARTVAELALSLAAGAASAAGAAGAASAVAAGGAFCLRNDSSASSSAVSSVASSLSGSRSSLPGGGSQSSIPSPEPYPPTQGRGLFYSYDPSVGFAGERSSPPLPLQQVRFAPPAEPESLPPPAAAVAAPPALSASLAAAVQLIPREFAAGEPTAEALAELLPGLCAAVADVLGALPPAAGRPDGFAGVADDLKRHMEALKEYAALGELRGPDVQGAKAVLAAIRHTLARARLQVMAEAAEMSAPV